MNCSLRRLALTIALAGFCSRYTSHVTKHGGGRSCSGAFSWPFRSQACQGGENETSKGLRQLSFAISTTGKKREQFCNDGS
jgi:hypothetical protein